ncbi:MAG: polyketide synthase, partial [Chloroflexi bacterium]
FGLLEGWWLYEDSALRLPGSPILAPETWQAVLQQEGFHRLFLPVPGANILGQQMIVAEACVPCATGGVVRQLSVEQGQSKDEIVAFTTSYLVNVLSTVLKISPEKLDLQTGFHEYGLDSIVVQRLHAMLEEVFGPMPATTFFRYKCIRDLADYFLKEHTETLHALFQQERDTQSPQPKVVGVGQGNREGHHFKEIIVGGGETDDVGRGPSVDPVPTDQLRVSQDIAIIGISGCYPQAENLEAFWRNLESGRDCIIEIPQERWDYRKYFQPDNGRGDKTGGMYCKWGGFLSDIDAFDAAFFRISPLEARLMDPQERLFLQIVSTCLEDAGYSRQRLRDEDAGDGRANVGVFAGVTYNNYQLHLLSEHEQGNFVPISSQTYSIANRVSYIYNLRGPSVVLDTACSSSLFAIHLACESIKRGECAMALAGGVNLSLHPSKYLTLCATQFASSGGHCRSFGEDGDGIVPGEGVGAVLLKPLREAIADRDHIYAVIKGTAVNNDGKTFGYSVPN